MDRKTLSIWGWTIVVVLVLSVMIVFATPLSKAVSNGILNVVDHFGEHEHTPGSEATCTTPQECTSCGKIIATALGHNYVMVTSEGDTAATCTTTGQAKYSCTVCSDSYMGTIASLGHSPSSEWSNDENGHWHVCLNDCGTMLDEAEHTPNIEAATATEAKYCTVCDYVIDEAIGEEECSHPTYKEDYQAPTCTASGYHVKTCAVCGETLYSAGWPATGHTPGAEATCTTAQTCTNCDYVYAEAFGHDYEIVKLESVPATCTSSGTTRLYCNRCKTETTEQAPALGHNKGPAATCTTAQTCTRCNYVYAEALGHNITSVSTPVQWDENSGFILSGCSCSGQCSRCGTVQGTISLSDDGSTLYYYLDGKLVETAYLTPTFVYDPELGWVTKYTKS